MDTSKTVVACAVCGKPLTAVQVRHGNEFCSRKCYKASAFIDDIVKPCAHCGVLFATRRHHAASYCSHACKCAAQELWGTCETCGVKFRGGRERRFCSRQCHSESRKKRVVTVCATCGGCLELKQSENRAAPRHYCSVACKNKGYSKFHSGPRNWNYTGSRRTNIGYIQIRVEELRGRDSELAAAMVSGKSHPHNIWVFEHRLVKARELDRPLVSGEVVHHLNGIKDDNRPENLELATGHYDHRKTHASFYQELQELRRENERLRMQLAPA